jgi:hypothetical protein
MYIRLSLLVAGGHLGHTGDKQDHAHFFRAKLLVSRRKNQRVVSVPDLDRYIAIRVTFAGERVDLRWSFLRACDAATEY